GDLDVTEVRGLGLDDRGDVVAVDRHVEQVGEHSDVLGSVGADPGDDRGGVGVALERVVLGAGDGFDEDRSVDLRHRAGGQGEIGQGRRVLVRGVLALGAQSVEGVEGPASGAAADLDDDVDVGGEVRLGTEDRDHAPVTAG